MEKQETGMPGIWVLAGIGAGVLTGALVGSVLSRRLNEASVDPVIESVELLRSKAQNVMTELAANVRQVVDRSLESYDTATAPISKENR